MELDVLNPGDLVPRPDPTRLTISALSSARKDIEQLFNAKLITIEQKIADNRSLNEQALQSAEKAITKAEVATSDRFDSVNEFRRTLSDQNATFLSRSEYAVAHKSLVDRVDSLTSRLAALEAHTQGRSAGLSWAGTITMSLVTGVAVLISMAALAFNILKHGG